MGTLRGLLGTTVVAGIVAVTMGCAAPEAPSRAMMWVDVYRGEPIAEAELLDDLATAQVVYVGERHGVARHHDLQLWVVQELIAREVPLVLGLEQLEVGYQPVVDRYNRGEITLDELVTETEWAKRWTNYRDYVPIVAAAHAAGAPVVALNARLELVRAVARNGIDGLEPESRSELPAEILLDDPMYEEHMNRVMMVHAGVTEEMCRRYFEAQVARDETMAAALVGFLNSPAGQGRTAVVLCGAGHVSQGMGIPTRVRARMPGVRDRIVLMSESGDVELSEGARKMARDIEITHQQLRALDRPIADYLHVTSPKLEEIPDGDAGEASGKG